VPFHQGLEEDYTTLASNMAGDHLRVVKFQVSQPPEQGTLALPGFSPTDDSLSDLLQADIEREFAAEKFDLKTFPTLSFLPKNSTQVIKFPTDRRDVDTMTMWINTLSSK